MKDMARLTYRVTQDAAKFVQACLGRRVWQFHNTIIPVQEYCYDSEDHAKQKSVLKNIFRQLFKNSFLKIITQRALEQLSFSLEIALLPFCPELQKNMNSIIPRFSKFWLVVVSPTHLCVCHLVCLCPLHHPSNASRCP